MYNSLVVLVCWWVFCLPGLALAQIASKVILYNSAYDYFEGDQLEYVTYQQLVKELKHYPSNYSLIGLGTVLQGNWSGAAIISGTVSKPIIYQTVTEEPHLFQPLNQDSFSWLELAICNPRRRLERKMKGVKDIHRFIANQLQNGGNIKLAAIRVNGSFSNISYSPQPMAKNPPHSPPSPTTGEPPQEWELLGLYFRDYELQLAGAVSGRPVILFGIDGHWQRGGYLQAASAIEAKVSIYPLMEYQLRQSDLSIAAARLEKKLLVRVKNEGQLDVHQVQVKMSIPKTTTEEVVVISIPAQEEAIVEFKRPIELNPGQILFQIDPQGLVRELREDNNVLDFYLNQRR